MRTVAATVAVPQPVPRDRAGEIDAAIAALTADSGPIAIDTPANRADGEREIRFVTRQQPLPQRSGGDWLPFHANVAEIAVDGPTLLVGLGAPTTGPDALENARAAGAAAAARLTGGQVRIDAPTRSPAIVAAIVEGLACGYRGDSPVQLHIDPTVAAAARRGLLVADALRLAQLLVNAPANLVTPARAAAWATDLAAKAGLDCSVLGPDEVSAQGFGALAAIGGGSANGPHLVQLHHARDGSSNRRIALVGKGITFDSGGLSLKSPSAMQAMRLDVAGAATVLAVMAALTRGGCRTDVHAVLPFAENLPGPGAARPGDVVTAWNGTQIQLLDLDFEGRVVLADALAVAAARNPDLLVDLATLTHQAEIALGPEIAAVLGRDDAAINKVLTAARAVGEPMWQLPWASRYLDQVRTGFGVRNHPLTDTGRAITAALFLGEFVPPDTPWAHIDMVGPAWRGDASVDGATGFGTRTLLELLLPSS